ncbi:hypothetical protein PMAYCL1PPCAC_17424, partial [Pristionchus mayeri]
IPHWTESNKWRSNKTTARHFTQIYQCIQMIAWEEINGIETDMSMAPERTLLYMRDGQKPNSGKITLSFSTSFSGASWLIDQAREWAGAVDVIVVGDDQERMQMRDFLDQHKQAIGARVSVHFVHRRKNLDETLFMHYLHKLSADISRTDSILLAFDIDALSISLQTYKILASAPSERFTVIHSKSAREIGLLTTKKNAQRYAAEGKSIEETAKLLK